MFAQTEEFRPLTSPFVWAPTGNVRLARDVFGFLVIKVEEQRYARFWLRPGHRLKSRWRLARPHHVRFIEMLYAAERSFR